MEELKEGLPEGLRGEASQEAGPAEAGPQPEARPEQATEQGTERVGELMAKLSAHGAALRPHDPNGIQGDARALADADEQARVAKLMRLADEKGVVHAVQVARKLADYYALDVLRDELVEQLHQKLEGELGSK